MWEGEPRYMAGLVKMMNAFGELCHEFSEQMTPYMEVQLPILSLGSIYEQDCCRWPGMMRPVGE